MDEWLYDPRKNRRRADAETYGPGLLNREGVAVVAGESNTGKSSWLVSMLNWWSGGPPYFDYDRLADVGGTPLFWYFAFEDGNTMRNAFDGFKSTYTEALDPQRPQDSYKKIEGGAFAQYDLPYQVLFTPHAGALDLTDLENVDAFCERVYGALDKAELFVDNPQIVVIDNMNLCIGDADENESRTARRVIRGLERIREYLGAALVILVHHTARDSIMPAGSATLFRLAHSVAILAGTGETITVTNTKMKGAPSKAKRKYRRIVRHINGTGLSFVDFEDITDAKPAQGPLEAPTDAPTDATVPSAPAPAQTASAHPSAQLRGLPLEVWRLLALGAGASIGADAAKVKAMELPTFAGLEPRRRSSRFSQVLDALAKAGLYDEKTGQITNV